MSVGAGADADSHEEATEEEFNNTSMLTMPIAGMDIQEDETHAAEEQQQQQQQPEEEAAEPAAHEEAAADAAEPVETVEAPQVVAAVESAVEFAVESAVAAAAEQAEEDATAEEEEAVVAPVVEAATAAEIVAEIAVVETEPAQPEEVKEVQEEDEEDEIGVSVIESDATDAAAEGTLIEATLGSDSLNASLNNDNDAGMCASRGSLVFASLRSSLPMLAPQALASASESIEQKHEEHKATDEEVEALQQSMLDAETQAHTSPELVEAQAQAQAEQEDEPEAAVELVATAPLFAQPESEDIAAPLDLLQEDSMEDHETAQRLADQFAAVADTPRIGRTPSKSVLPSARRATTAAVASSGSVPSFLRPTAAAAAKARQTMHVATPSHVTTSRGNSLTRSAAKQAAATAATPKPTKKSAHTLFHSAPATPAARQQVDAHWLSFRLGLEIDTRFFVLVVLVRCIVSCVFVARVCAGALLPRRTWMSLLVRARRSRRATSRRTSPDRPRRRRPSTHRCRS